VPMVMEGSNEMDSLAGQKGFKPSVNHGVRPGVTHIKRHHAEPSVAIPSVLTPTAG
jgi:hypothetical protein